MHSETLAVHGNYHASQSGQPAVEPVISSTVFRHTAQGLDKDGFSYTRHNNPNRENLEKTLAGLEKGAHAACFSSGMAATQAVLMALNPGDHVVFPQDVYHGTRALLQSTMQRWGLKSSAADMRNGADISEKITPKTKLIWLETPSNPMLHLTDIVEVRKVAGDEISILVDNTWMTPLLQKPLELGADLVLHSSTKYLGGHSDLLGGVVISSRDIELFKGVRHQQQAGGAVPSPFDCWMLSRSLKSLSARMRLHQENAMKVAHFLEGHPKVEAVLYPGLSGHVGHELMKKQASGFGAMMSFLVKGGNNETLKVVNSSRLIMPATSLGGAESSWEHRKSSEGEGSETPENLIRLSVGLEHVEDILNDVKLALGYISI